MKDRTRFPRTLIEAFGPYTSSRIDEPRPLMQPHERVIVALALATLLGIALGVL